MTDTEVELLEPADAHHRLVDRELGPGRGGRQHDQPWRRPGTVAPVRHRGTRRGPRGGRAGGLGPQGDDVIADADAVSVLEVSRRVDAQPVDRHTVVRAEIFEAIALRLL